MKFSLDGVNKPLLFMTLFNNAISRAVFVKDVITLEEATEILKERFTFDYFEGKSLKVAFGQSIRLDLYKRDNGELALKRAIEQYFSLVKL